MAFLTSGWKDILRPIRDGLRDGFIPPKDTGPTPVEREQRRLEDHLKGFAYFDTFKQVEEWDPSYTDGLQQSNTPLVRSRNDEPKSERPLKSNHADVLLCHDSSGNYHDYESGESGVDAEVYSCEYLQNVEIFVYFSHKLVCIPPALWINTMHRNGVRVLGTYLVERQTPEIHHMLARQTQSDGVSPRAFTVARQLAAMARTYGFDGWLINIEKPFDKEHWDLYGLLEFIQQLKDDLGPDGRVIWYDALTVNNKVAYQNCLTSQNIAFANVASGILTNYRWTERKAKESVPLAKQNQIPLGNVYFGIDVWAQNTNQTGPTRITYPENDGGGTNTGVGVSKLAEFGFSAGIFAPAWSFEHFPGRGRVVEEAIWQGKQLPDDLVCDCRYPRHMTHQYMLYAVQTYAACFDASSRRFFFTDFNRGVTAHHSADKDIYSGKAMHTQIGAQSVLPIPWNCNPKNVEWSNRSPISWKLKDRPARLDICWDSNIVPLPITNKHELKLYDLRVAGNLNVTVHYTTSIFVNETQSSGRPARITFELGYRSPKHGPENWSAWSINFPSSPSPSTPSVVTAPINCIDSSIYYLSVTISNMPPPPSPPPEQPIPLFSLHSISITPQHMPALIATIADIRLTTATSGPYSQLRLAWTFALPSTAELPPPKLGRDEYSSGEVWEKIDEPLPSSPTTGPFAHFELHVEGRKIGRAYCCTHAIPACFVEKVKRGEDLSVQIVGVGFDGQRCEGETVSVKWKEPLNEGWIAVRGGEAETG